jgi:hypothetical protein
MGEASGDSVGGAWQRVKKNYTTPGVLAMRRLPQWPGPKGSVATEKLVRAQRNPRARSPFSLNRQGENHGRRKQETAERPAGRLA